MRLIKYLIFTTVVFISLSINGYSQIIADLPSSSVSNFPVDEAKFQTKTPELSILDSDKRDSVESLKNQKVIYFELFGSGGFYSVNYEHFIQDRISLRGGISYMFHTKEKSFIDFGGLVVIPISINKLMHLQNDSYLETSIGSSLAFDDDHRGVFIVSGIAFREQPPGNRGFARVSLNPFLYFDDGAKVGITAGISVGFSFK